MGKPRMSYRCTVLLACLSCATIASIVILHRPAHLSRTLYVVSRSQTPKAVWPRQTTLYVGNDSSGDESHSYVMAIRYQEQLTSGIRNALQLSHLFRKHGSLLVEPFIAGTMLYGLVPRSHPLGTVLDFNAIARECFHINNIASFDDFLHKSTRDIILLHPVSNPNPNTVLGVGPVYSVKQRWSAKDILPCLLEQGVCQCSKEFGDYARSLEQALNVYLNHTAPMFRVRQVICFNKLKSMTVEQFLKAAGLQETEVYSYIFTAWFGTSCTSMPRGKSPGAAKYSSKARCPGTFRARFIPETRPPGVCGKGKVDHSYISTEFLSPDLKDLAAKFASSHRSGTGTKISIHFRTEWLTIRSKIECCQPTIVDILKMIVKTYNADNVLFVTDLGPFGTKSCDHQCRTGGKQLIQSVEDSTGLKPVHFDPVNYSAKFEGGGIIAPLVENAALSDAEVLVLIGGGKFQSSILSSALLSSSLKHVYSVCSPSTLLDLPDGIVLHSNYGTCTKQ